jgi:hypothetical protein
MPGPQDPQLVRRVIHNGRVQGAGWHLEAVFGPDGEIQLYDIYIANDWRGSKRTEKQCLDFLRQAGADVPPSTQVPW